MSFGVAEKRFCGFHFFLLDNLKYSFATTIDVINSFTPQETLEVKI